MAEKKKKELKPAPPVIEQQQFIALVSGRRGQKDNEYIQSNQIKIKENLESQFVRNKFAQTAIVDKPEYLPPQTEYVQTQPQFYNHVSQFSNQNIQETQLNRMNEQISINIYPKKQKLQTYLNRIENRIQEIIANAKEIEKQTRDFSEEIILRLRNFVNLKLQPIQQEKSEIMRELQLLDDSLNQYNALPNLKTQQAQVLLQNIEALSINNIYPSLSMLVDDLPQEINEIKKIKIENIKLKQLMEFKNEVIWKIYSESQQQQNQLKAELEFQANEEISKWYQLIEQYQEELNKYKLACCFCGLNFDYQLINTDCNYNQNESDIQLKVQLKQNPDQSYYGNGKHFFSQIKQ